MDLVMRLLIITNILINYLIITLLSLNNWIVRDCSLNTNKISNTNSNSNFKNKHWVHLILYSCNVNINVLFSFIIKEKAKPLNHIKLTLGTLLKFQIKPFHTLQLFLIFLKAFNSNCLSPNHKITNKQITKKHNTLHITWKPCVTHKSNNISFFLL